MKRRHLILKIAGLLSAVLFFKSCGKDKGVSNQVNNAGETDLDTKANSGAKDQKNTEDNTDSKDQVPDNSVNSEERPLDNKSEPTKCEVSKPDVEGPFYRQNPPERVELCSSCNNAQKILIRGKVSDSDDCQLKLKNVSIDVWHADIAGEYDMDSPEFNYRGVVKTTGDGTFEFKTIMPGRYKLGPSFRPAHLHVKIKGSGYKELITQLYFKGDPYLAPSDPCGLTCKSDDPFRILDMKKENEYLAGEYNIVLKKI